MLPIKSPLNSDTTKAVGIWLRVSTEDQVKGESLDVHEDRARSYAQLKGWDVREVYRLEAVSGKSVSDHPETKRMLSDIQRGHVTALIFSKLARLSRNNRELLEFADFFKAYNADLVSLAESIDTSTPAGRMFYNMLASMANWEREEISARVAASIPIRAKMGRLLGGPTIYGYRTVDKKLEIDPVEGPIRAQMYELFKQHRRKKVVAKMLNDFGHRTRKGALFTDTTVDRLLRDSSAKGVHRANYTTNLSDKKGWALKDKSDWVYQPCPALVSETLWNEVVTMLDEKRVMGKRQTKQVRHLFAGYTYCHCGTKMSVLSKMTKYCCTTCKNKISIETLDAIFSSELKGFVFNPTEIAAHKRQAAIVLAEVTNSVIMHEESIRKVNQEVDVMIELFRMQMISQSDFKDRYAPLSEQLEQLKAELPKLQARRDVLSISITSQEDVMEESKDLALRFHDMEEKQRRSIVETIIDRIEVGKDEVEITFLFNPNPKPIDNMQSPARRELSPSPQTPLGTDRIRATNPSSFVYL